MARGLSIGCLLFFSLGSALAETAIVARLTFTSLRADLRKSIVFLPSRSLMAVADPDARMIFLVDPRTATTVKSISLSASPGALALSPDGKILATVLISTNLVVLIDTSTDTVRASVPAIGASYRDSSALVFAADGTRLYVSDPGLNSVVVINSVNNSFVRAIQVGQGPAAMALQPGRNLLAVVNTGQGFLPNDTISLINTTSLTVQLTALTGADFDALSEIHFRPDGQLAFISSAATPRLIILDMGSLNTRSLEIVGGASSLLLNSSGTRLWAASSSANAVALVNTSSTENITVLKTFTFPRADFSISNNLTFGVDENTMYLPAAASRELIAFTASTGEVLQRVKLDFPPGGVVSLPNARMLYLASSSTATLFYLSPEARTFVLPVLKESPGEYTGLAMVNLSGYPARVNLTAYSPRGTIISAPQSLNPIFLILENRQQNAQLARQLFKLGQWEEYEGWMEVVVPNPAVSVFSLQGDVSQTRLDGAIPDSPPATHIFLTRAGSPSPTTGAVSQRLHIINPNDTLTYVTVRRFDASGTERGRTIRLLPAKGKLSETTDAILGPPLATSGYLRLEADLPVSAYQELRTTSAVFGFTHRNAPISAGSLYAVQMASGGRQEAGAAYFSELNLINTGISAATLQVLAIGDNGQPLQGPGINNPVSIMLQPGQQLLTAIDTLFHLPAAATDPKLTSGSLFITGQTSGVIGDLVFGDIDSGRFISGLNLTPDTAAKGLFAQLAEGPSGDVPVNFFTGAGFLNPGSTATTIELQAFNLNGVRLGAVFIVLRPHQRISQTIGEWMPLLGAHRSGYLLFTVDGPGVASFAVFGDKLLNFLAAVPSFPLN